MPQSSGRSSVTMGVLAWVDPDPKLLVEMQLPGDSYLVPFWF